MIGIILGTIFVILIVVGVTCVANWRIFEKAGYPGWYALIPIYNVYVQYDMCWDGRIGIYSLFLTIILGVYIALGWDSVLTVPGFALVTAIQTAFCVRFASAFGKGPVMGIVLFFASGIGRMILGFGRSQYIKEVN